MEFLEIVATPVVTTKSAADVFEPLATAGILTVVWHFDNDTKAWSFYDPRPEVAAAVDLTMVSSGDNVWIQVTADMDFQGETPDLDRRLEQYHPQLGPRDRNQARRGRATSGRRPRPTLL